MDVNVTSKCVLIVVVGPPQPQNPAHNRIASGRIRLQDLTRRTAAFEHGPRLLPVADLLGHLHSTQWSPVRSRLISQAELRSRYLVGFHRLTVANQKHFLIPDTHNHLVAVILFDRRTTAVEEER